MSDEASAADGASPRTTSRAAFRLDGADHAVFSLEPAAQLALYRAALPGHPVGRPVEPALLARFNRRQVDRLIGDLHRDGGEDALQLAGLFVHARLMLAGRGAR